MNLPPIKTREANSRPTTYEEREWTYEQILRIFPDDGDNLVYPLVRRCQALEQALEAMHLQRDVLALNWVGLGSSVYVAYIGSHDLEVVWPDNVSGSQRAVEFPPWYQRQLPTKKDEQAKADGQ